MCSFEFKQIQQLRQDCIIHSSVICDEININLLDTHPEFLQIQGIQIENFNKPVNIFMSEMIFKKLCKNILIIQLQDLNILQSQLLMVRFRTIVPVSGDFEWKN